MYYVKKYHPSPFICEDEWIKNNHGAHCTHGTHGANSNCCCCNSNSGNTGNTGSIGNSGNSGNTGNTGNNSLWNPTQQTRFGSMEESQFPITNVGFLDDDNVIIEVELPGYKKEKISITYENSRITLEADYLDTDIYPESISYIINKNSRYKVKRNFYLANEYANATVGWQYVNGLVVIKVTKTSQSSTSIQESNLFGN